MERLNLLKSKDRPLSPNRLECFVCKERFWMTTKYLNHMSSHNLLLLLCNVCNKSFYDQKLLDAHYLTHNEVINMYDCTKCIRKFPQKHQLEQHMDFHSINIENPPEMESEEKRFSSNKIPKLKYIPNEEEVSSYGVPNYKNYKTFDREWHEDDTDSKASKIKEIRKNKIMKTKLINQFLKKAKRKCCNKSGGVLKKKYLPVSETVLQPKVPAVASKADQISKNKTPNNKSSSFTKHKLKQHMGHPIEIPPLTTRKKRFTFTNVLRSKYIGNEDISFRGTPDYENDPTFDCDWRGECLSDPDWNDNSKIKKKRKNKIVKTRKLNKFKKESKRKFYKKSGGVLKKTPVGETVLKPKVPTVTSENDQTSKKLLNKVKSMKPNSKSSSFTKHQFTQRMEFRSMSTENPPLECKKKGLGFKNILKSKYISDEDISSDGIPGYDNDPIFECDSRGEYNSDPDWNDDSKIKEIHKSLAEFLKRQKLANKSGELLKKMPVSDTVLQPKIPAVGSETDQISKPSNKAKKKCKSKIVKIRKLNKFKKESKRKFYKKSSGVLKKTPVSETVLKHKVPAVANENDQISKRLLDKVKSMKPNSNSSSFTKHQFKQYMDFHSISTENPSLKCKKKRLGFNNILKSKYISDEDISSDGIPVYDNDPKFECDSRGEYNSDPDWNDDSKIKEIHKSLAEFLKRQKLANKSSEVLKKMPVSDTVLQPKIPAVASETDQISKPLNKVPSNKSSEKTTASDGKCYPKSSIKERRLKFKHLKLDNTNSKKNSSQTARSDNLRLRLNNSNLKKAVLETARNISINVESNQNNKSSFENLNVSGMSSAASFPSSNKNSLSVSVAPRVKKQFLSDKEPKKDLGNFFDFAVKLKSVCNEIVRQYSNARLSSAEGNKNASKSNICKPNQTAKSINFNLPNSSSLKRSLPAITGFQNSNPAKKIKNNSLNSQTGILSTKIVNNFDVKDTPENMKEMQQETLQLRSNTKIDSSRSCEKTTVDSNSPNVSHIPTSIANDFVVPIVTSKKSKIKEKEKLHMNTESTTKQNELFSTEESNNTDLMDSDESVQTKVSSSTTIDHIYSANSEKTKMPARENKIPSMGENLNKTADMKFVANSYTVKSSVESYVALENISLIGETSNTTFETKYVSNIDVVKSAAEDCVVENKILSIGENCGVKENVKTVEKHNSKTQKELDSETVGETLENQPKISPNPLKLKGFNYQVNSKPDMAEQNAIDKAHEICLKIENKLSDAEYLSCLSTLDNLIASFNISIKCLFIFKALRFCRRYVESYDVKERAILLHQKMTKSLKRKNN